MATNVNLYPLDTFGLLGPMTSIPYIEKGQGATTLKSGVKGAFILTV